MANLLGKLLPQFDSKINAPYICPMCLKPLDTKNTNQVTKGHIIPEASGGKDWVPLCKQCNSDFGKNQDKWLGEYINLITNDKSTIVDAKTKSKYINIDGKKLSGKVQPSNDGGIDVFLYHDLNPPGVVKNLRFSEIIEISFTPEILKHENDIKMGFVIAAYLMWFEKIHWNWVFHAPMDRVRSQILNNEFDGVATTYVIDLPQKPIKEPSIGFAEHKDTYYPAAMICDKMVIFPNYKSELPNKDFLHREKLEFIFIGLEAFEVPHGVAMFDQVVICPIIKNGSTRIPELMLKITGDNGNPIKWGKLSENA